MYKLTGDQITVLREAVKLMGLRQNTSCLIQGDVSSGKTIVIAMLMFLMANTGFKSVYIVPRKILRLQHLKTLRAYNELLDLNLKIVDGADEFYGDDVDIVVNGYSFSNKSFETINFDLGVIDEIQLLGVEQRNQVQDKFPNIDMFYTTATPHPRTKLISLIGHMNVLEIREMPPGRKQKETRIFSKLDDNDKQLIRDEVKKGYAVLVVCPLVNSKGANLYENVHQAYNWYQQEFPDLKVEKLLSQYGDEKKINIIERTISGQIDILVATKTIEVGIDIPRASVIIIHYPHTNRIKWGVSQLHQLRGRVGRDNQESYCLIEYPGIPEEKSPVGSVLRTQDVFVLTENDFDWRGFENIIGTRQSGKKGSKEEQRIRIMAYEKIAHSTPIMINELSEEVIQKLETSISDKRLADLN